MLFKIILISSKNFIIYHNFHFLTSTPNPFSCKEKGNYDFLSFQERIVCLGED